MLLGGCFGGNPTRPVADRVDEKAVEGKVEGLNTESGEATRFAIEGTRQRRWSVAWQSAQLQYTDEGRVFGTMNTVQGSIFEKDKPVSDYFGDHAVSKLENDVLALEGNVRVVSRNPKGTLYCERLEWHGELGLVVAKGNVRMESDTYSFGTAPEIWCAPDLSRVGTPKEYHARSNMDVRAKLALPLLAVAAMGAGQGKRILLGSGEDRFELTNLDGGYSQMAGPGKFEFVGNGNPLRGKWGSQKVDFEAKRIEGKASEGPRGAMLIDTAKMDGGVVLNAKRPSKIPNGTEQEIQLLCRTLDYVRATERMTLTGATTITQTDRAARHSLKVTGSGGWVVLYPPGEAPQARRGIKEARFDGPVTFVLTSQREVADPDQAGKTIWKPYTVNGKAARMEYDDAARRMTLIGNVEIDADDAPWIGEIRTTRLSLLFDDLGNPIRVDLDEPATTTVRETRPPGRRR